jgi:hypothetical protein
MSQVCGSRLQGLVMFQVTLSVFACGLFLVPIRSAYSAGGNRENCASVHRGGCTLK